MTARFLRTAGWMTAGAKRQVRTTRTRKGNRDLPQLRLDHFLRARPAIHRLAGLREAVGRPARRQCTNTGGPLDAGRSELPHTHAHTAIRTWRAGGHSNGRCRHLAAWIGDSFRRI